MKNKNIQAIFFDIDDTLYDSTLQTREARRNSVKAMIEAGLDVDERDCLTVLKRIVKRFGSNYQHHFDELLSYFGYEKNPRIIAAGVVAYHTTKIAYLVPFPDTVPTLLKLRDKGFTLGVITDGIAVKQWEKLIRLGLQHFFHTVVVSKNQEQKPSGSVFRETLKKIRCKAENAIMVGDRVDRDIRGANVVGMTTIQISLGKYRKLKPRDELEEPDYVISRLSDILRILDT